MTTRPNTLTKAEHSDPPKDSLPFPKPYLYTHRQTLPLKLPRTTHSHLVSLSFVQFPLCFPTLENLPVRVSPFSSPFTYTFGQVESVKPSPGSMLAERWRATPRKAGGRPDSVDGSGWVKFLPSNGPGNVSIRPCRVHQKRCWTLGVRQLHAITSEASRLQLATGRGRATGDGYRRTRFVFVVCVCASFCIYATLFLVQAKGEPGQSGDGI